MTNKINVQYNVDIFCDNNRGRGELDIKSNTPFEYVKVIHASLENSFNTSLKLNTVERCIRVWKKTQRSKLGQ